jgi:hypothetical protein
VQVLEQPAGAPAGGEDSGLGPGGVLAQSNRAAVAAPPVLVDHPDQQQMPGGAGHLLQRGADRLGDQFQPRQAAHRGRHMGGVGALTGALAHQSGLLQALQRQIQQTVDAIVTGQALAEVGQHAVVEARIVQLHGQGVLEVHAAAHRLSRLTVRQVEQELQHAHGGQLGGREAGAPVARIPADEVLIAPQPVQPVTHPHRRRTTRIGRPRDLRSQGRNLLTTTGTDGQRTPQLTATGLRTPRAYPIRTLLRHEAPRSPTESS